MDSITFCRSKSPGGEEGESGQSWAREGIKLKEGASQVLWACWSPHSSQAEGAGAPTRAVAHPCCSWKRISSGVRGCKGREGLPLTHQQALLPPERQPPLGCSAGSTHWLLRSLHSHWVPSTRDAGKGSGPQSHDPGPSTGDAAGKAGAPCWWEHGAWSKDQRLCQGWGRLAPCRERPRLAPSAPRAVYSPGGRDLLAVKD